MFHHQVARFYVLISPGHLVATPQLNSPKFCNGCTALCVYVTLATLSKSCLMLQRWALGGGWERRKSRVGFVGSFTAEQLNVCRLR